MEFCRAAAKAAKRVVPWLIEAISHPAEIIRISAGFLYFRKGSAMKKLFISDFTLRKYIQDGRDDLLFREKTAIAACIDNIGADQIELPPVKKEKEDRIVYRTIASMVTAQIAIPAGYSEREIDLAWECIKNAEKPCLQVMLPVAAAQMEYTFRAKEASMLKSIAELVSFAASRCKTVEFAALDATRADPDFLLKACLTAQENGATCLTICDDTGASLPNELAQIVTRVKSACPLPLFISLTDHIGMAQACAYAAVAAGADGVKTSMIGSDTLSTERFASMIQARGEYIGVCTGLNITELHRDISQTLRHTGREASAVSTGEHSAADIFLDAESTLSDVCDAAKALGYSLSDEDNGNVYKALKQVCERKSSLGTKEFEALIASHAMQAPSTYHLGSYSATCTNMGVAMAQVTLRRDEEILMGVATGDGPVDAVFRAIEQSIGYHYELDDFQIQSVTEGKEALGSTLVRLRNNGKLYAGNGLSTDIVGSSIRAYINALNKIVFEEN